MTSILKVDQIQNTAGTTTQIVAKSAFLAEYAGGRRNHSGEYVVFDRVNHNTGNNYNSSTGIYTCPYDGLYWFGSSARGDNNAGVRSHIGIHVNNSAYPYSDSRLGDQLTSSSAGIDSAYGAYVLSLSAGNTVRIYHYGSQYDPGITYFTGYFIG